MKRPSLIFLIPFLGSAHLFAHETWLAPFSSGDPGRFDLTSGMKFPKLEYAILPERIAEAHARADGKQLDVKVLGRDEHSLHFQIAPPPPGIITAWVRLLPKTLELSPAKVAEYFAEIDATPAVRDTWKAWKKFGPWKETYTKSAKTFLRVGETGNDESWKAAVGLPLEIVPSADPTHFMVGDKAEFQLLENGQPLPAIALGVMTEGKNKRSFVITDDTGHATVVFDRAGRTLIFAVHLQPSANHEWKSNFTTVALQVGERP